MAENLILENARIFFRNFAGEADQYNRAGNRNFCVEIDDPGLAEKLKSDGWNIKLQKKRDPEDDDKWYIQVTVSYTNIPPNVYLVTKKQKTLMTEDTIKTLDYAELDNVDLVISPYHWAVNGNEGIKAYLRSGYFTIKEDTFGEKYSHIGEDTYNPPFGPPYAPELPWED